MPRDGAGRGSRRIKFKLYYKFKYTGTASTYTSTTKGRQELETGTIKKESMKDSRGAKIEQESIEGGMSSIYLTGLLNSHDAARFLTTLL